MVMHMQHQAVGRQQKIKENRGWYCVRSICFSSYSWSYGAGRQWTGTIAFRGLCDVTSSLSFNPVPVREDYTPEHTHTLPMEPQSDRPHSPLSYIHSEEGREGKGTRDVKGGKKDSQGRVWGIEREREGEKVAEEFEVKEAVKERWMEQREWGKRWLTEREGKMSGERLGLEANWWKEKHMEGEREKRTVERCNMVRE